MNLQEAATKIKLKTLANKLKGMKYPAVVNIVKQLEQGIVPSKDIMKLKGSLQDDVVMAMAEVLGPEETTKALGEETMLKEFKVKTVKVGEDAVGADEPHYALVKEREVIAIGSKQEMLDLCKEEGGRVWLTAKDIGDIVEEVDLEEASPMIKPPRNEFSKKADAFAYAKKNGGKVMKRTFTHSLSGRQYVTYIVKEEAERIVEISKELAGRYLNKSTEMMKRHAHVVNRLTREEVKRIVEISQQLVEVNTEAQKEQKLKNLRRRLKDAKGRQKTTLEKQIADLEKEMGELSQEKQKSKGRQYVSDTEKGETNIIMQLRSAQDLGGNKEITFRRGTGKVGKADIDFILKLHDALNPEGRRRLRIAAGQDRASLQKIVAQYKGRFNECVDHFYALAEASKIGEMTVIDGDDSGPADSEKVASKKKKKKEGPEPDSKDAEYSKSNNKDSCTEEKVPESAIRSSLQAFGFTKRNLPELAKKMTYKGKKVRYDAKTNSLVTEATTRAGGVSGTVSRKTVDTFKDRRGDDWEYDEVKTPMGSVFRTITKISQGGKSLKNAYGGYSAWATGAPKYTDRKWKMLKSSLQEDLRNWFGKGKMGDWVRVGTDGEIKGACAREPGEGKPKCMPRDKAHSMSKDERATAARRKRREDPVVDRPGTGNKPIMVKTNEEFIFEKNVPTDPALWAKWKAAAKDKFDIYPSAYANGWAAKMYKKDGGEWKTVTEETKSWRSEGHYTKDGKEWTGDQHSHQGQVMTGKEHTKDSQNLYHFKELSAEVQKKILKKLNVQQEEQIVEVLKASDPIDKWISDFVNSNNPKFQGKSKDERIKMAKGAWYAAQRGEN